MKKLSKTCAVCSTLVALALGAPLSANAQSTPAPSVGNVNVLPQDIRGGISAEQLLGMDARGTNGNSLGEIQHLIVNQSGQVAAVAIESGGFINIGDTHFRIPWNELKFGRDMDHVIIPLTEKTAERYRDVKETERARTGPGEFRLSRVKGADVTMGTANEGTVEDFIITRKGEIKAAIVDMRIGPGGRVAVPFVVKNYDFERNVYTAPFDRNQLAGARPFDYRAADVREPAVGATGGAGGGAVGDQPRRMPRQSRG